MKLLEKLASFICKYFTLWVILFSLIAFIKPEPFKPIGTYIPYLLGLIMLGMGLTMSLDDFKMVLTRPKDVFYGVVLRYLIMPFVGYAVAKLIGLPPSLAAGVVLIGACPSGTASNVMAFISKGDTALSVTVSSINTILAPLLTPYMFLLLAGTFIPIKAEALLIDIMKIVLLPVATGIAVRTYASATVDKFVKVIPVISIVSIITILSSVVALTAAKLSTVAGMVIIAVLAHNSLGLLLGYGSARAVGMDEKKSRAITFEIGMENSGLAVALAIAHLDPLAALPAAVCSIWQNISGSLLAGYWGARDSEKHDMPSVALAEEKS